MLGRSFFLYNTIVLKSTSNGIPGIFSLFCLVKTVDNKLKLPLTGFQPWISSVGSDSCTNRATITAQKTELTIVTFKKSWKIC